MVHGYVSHQVIHVGKPSFNIGRLCDVDVFVTSKCIHLYISYCISLYPDKDVCSSYWEIH